MKCTLINHQKGAAQEYHLTEQDQPKVIAKFHPQQQSVRIICAGQRRLFFIQMAGILSDRYNITNEYGLQIGNISHDKKLGNSGSVYIESEKYFFEIKNGEETILTIYNNTHQKIVSCSLNIADNEVSEYAVNENCLLLAICWYLFLPVVKESMAEFA
jgi:hypothetical protein